MKQNISSKFAERFHSASIQSLVESFNAQVGNRGFNSARAIHDDALINEFLCRGIDISAIFDGHTINFANRVIYDESTSRLLIL